jgi:hypothetical protein
MPYRKSRQLMADHGSEGRTALPKTTNGCWIAPTAVLFCAGAARGGWRYR